MARNKKTIYCSNAMDRYLEFLEKKGGKDLTDGKVFESLLTLKMLNDVDNSEYIADPDYIESLVRNFLIRGYNMTYDFRDNIAAMSFDAQLEIVRFFMEMNFVPNFLIRTNKQANIYYSSVSDDNMICYFALGDWTNTSVFETASTLAKNKNLNIQFIGTLSGSPEEYITISRYERLQSMKSYPYYNKLCMNLGLSTSPDFVFIHYKEMKHLIRAFKDTCI